MDKTIKELLQDLETTDLEKWCRTSMELANFGSSAIETLGQELLRSIESIKMPYGVVQRDLAFSFQEAAEIAKKTYGLKEGEAHLNGAIAINNRFSKMIARKKAVIQNVISQILYVDEGGSLDHVTAEEIWVAPNRTVNYVYAKYIFAGFPAPPELPKGALYEVDDPADGIIASGYNRAWGIIDTFIRIKDKKAIPVLQLAFKKTKSIIIRRAVLDCLEGIEEIK